MSKAQNEVIEYSAQQKKEPLYESHQPIDQSSISTKPLTSEEILSIARDHYNPRQRPEISFARAIETAWCIRVLE